MPRRLDFVHFQVGDTDVEVEHVLDQIEEEANVERTEAELQAAEAQIADTQEAVAKGWAEFIKMARKLKSQWEPLAVAVQQLDALPAGEPPTTPFPGDLLKAFELALTTEAGHSPFTDLPRVNPKRLAITRTDGMGAAAYTGWSRDMRSTGDYR